MRFIHGGRGLTAALAALVLALPLVVAACGGDATGSDRLVTHDRELARTPDQLDLNRPAWQRDWTPMRDP